MNPSNDLIVRLNEFSELYGTGALEQDVLFLLVLFLMFFVVIGSFFYLRSSRKSQVPQEIERLSGLAGRVERFEMDSNSVRSEIQRDIEFLRDRVETLEQQVVELQKGQGITPQPATDQTRARESSTRTRKDTQEYGSAAIKRVTEDEEPEPVRPTQELSAEKVKEIVPEKAEELSVRLKSSRKGFFSKIKDLFGSKEKIDEETLEELEAVLVGSDLGVELTRSLIADLKTSLESGSLITEEALTSILKQRVQSILEENAPADSSLPYQKFENDPRIIMMVGVNGVGKTTTCAKLAHQFKNSGAKVMLVAADTFRAAAVAQLKEWGSRLDVPVVHGEENAKPATVVFDAMEQAKKLEIDVVLIDTAGRLHNKANLMQELEGVKNTIQKHIPSGPHESILVVDGTTGQNAIQQAKEFHQASPLTGLVVTKLDGTPKGGIVAAIKSEMGIPVRYIGVGESHLDLRPFVPAQFVDALFDKTELLETETPTANAQKRRRRRRDTQGVQSGA